MKMKGKGMKIDPENCIAREACIPHCTVGAIHLGYLLYKIR